MTTLSNIRSLVRQITGRPSEDQLTDSQIDDQINQYYLYEMDEELRLLQLKTWYEFFTEPNVDTYNLPQTYFDIEQPIYVAGYQLGYTQYPNLFYNLWPQIETLTQVDTGDGSVGTYTGTTTGTPILQNFVTISAGEQVLTDDGEGLLVGDGAGTVNYLTGALSMDFDSAVDSDEPINAQYYIYSPSLPRNVLFYGQQLIFRPVPDQVYRVRINAYTSPTALLDDDSMPDMNEWWQMIAYGASLNILAQNAEWEQYQPFKQIYEEKKCMCQRRTLRQLVQQRTQTPYSSTGLNNYFWMQYNG